MRVFVWQTLVLIGLSPGCLFGLGIRIADQDPFATARGNAFAATADNPSAIYYNPAGITQLEGQNASYSIYAIYLNSHYTSASGTEVDTKDEIQAIPHLYYTYSMKEWPLTLGVGVYSPYGLGLEWPVNGPFNALATEGRIIYFTANPVAAVKLCSSLSVAAGVTINYSQAQLKRGLGFAPGEFKFKGDDLDVGYNVGIFWHPYPRHTFGVNYRSATTMEFSGHAEIPNYREDASARFRFPQNIIVGWSFRPTTNWNFEVNVDWTDWDDLDTVSLNAGPLLSGPVAFNWRSSFFYEFGATYFFENDFHLSGGYIFSENSVPQTSDAFPAVPDSDRHIFSVGIGRRYRRLSWDAAYQLAYGPRRSVNGTRFALADGRYEFISHALNLSIGYTF